MRHAPLTATIIYPLKSTICFAERDQYDHHTKLETNLEKKTKFFLSLIN